MVTHLLGWAPLVVMAVMRESSSSFFSFSFFTRLSIARLANVSLSPPCLWHMRLCTMLRHASLLVGVLVMDILIRLLCRRSGEYFLCLLFHIILLIIIIIMSTEVGEILSELTEINSTIFLEGLQHQTTRFEGEVSAEEITLLILPTGNDTFSRKLDLYTKYFNNKNDYKHNGI